MSEKKFPKATPCKSSKTVFNKKACTTLQIKSAESLSITEKAFLSRLVLNVEKKM